MPKRRIRDTHARETLSNDDFELYFDGASCSNSFSPEDQSDKPGDRSDKLGDQSDKLGGEISAETTVSVEEHWRECRAGAAKHHHTTR